MKNIPHLALIFCTALLCLQGAAYILKPETILNRLDKNQGSKNYKISQNILLLDRSRLDDVFPLKEIWWRYKNRAYLQVSSQKHPQLKLNFIYKNSRKTWISGKTKKSEEKNYIESYFFQNNMRPPWLKLVEKVSLGRALGMVNYVFKKKDQSLWIEQDNFVVRKAVMGKRAVLTAGNYHIYAGGLFFPKKRKYTDPEIEVSIQVSSVEIIKRKWSYSLTPHQWKLSNGDAEMIAQFYQNIR